MFPFSGGLLAAAAVVSSGKEDDNIQMRLLRQPVLNNNQLGIKIILRNAAEKQKMLGCIGVVLLDVALDHRRRRVVDRSVVDDEEVSNWHVLWIRETLRLLLFGHQKYCGDS